MYVPVSVSFPLSVSLARSFSIWLVIARAHTHTLDTIERREERIDRVFLRADLACSIVWVRRDCITSTRSLRLLMSTNSISVDEKCEESSEGNLVDVKGCPSMDSSVGVV